MNPKIPSAPRLVAPSALTSCQCLALRLLRDAQDAAQTEGRDIWHFAVEIEQLRSAGLSHTDLRRLLCWGLLEHARERTPGGARQRIFQHLNSSALPRRTCFVLTAKGASLASQHSLATPLAAGSEGVELDGFVPAVPRWDKQLRQLWWRDCLIKQFRVPAPNQEIVLAALEEDGWPARIDDPLPHTPGIDSKARLHDTIKSLNRHQQHRLLCFHGDGNGLGICWLLGECE